ncbi:MAG: hypothetical protein K1Y02_09150 [Candidatus Hydrogenedentes bacterium]|nr:hypothetical protein [Candidatus Hydrogenedentota bacterium]
MTVQCCKCKKVRIGRLWVEPSREVTGAVSHSYCPECAEACFIEIFSLQASKAPSMTTLYALANSVGR